MCKRIIFCLFILFTPVITNSNNSKPAIILNNDKFITIIDDITLRRIFTLQETRWPNGELIHVFVNNIDSIELKYFVEHRLNMTHYRYKQLIDSILTTPSEFDLTYVKNSTEMIHGVKSTVNSIGYLNDKLISNNREIVVISNEK